MSTSHETQLDVLEVSCGAPGDSTWCAGVALRYARLHGLSRGVASQVALAVAELVSNVARHGGGSGRLTLRLLEQPLGMEIQVRDTGPGIAAIELALEDGWSRGAKRTLDSPRDGLGTGLGAVRRAMDELQVGATPGGGTTIVARKYVNPTLLIERIKQGTST